MFAGRDRRHRARPDPADARVAGGDGRRPGAELIWASPREVLNIVQAEEIGCHIITVTHDLLGQAAPARQGPRRVLARHGEDVPRRRRVGRLHARGGRGEWLTEAASAAPAGSAGPCRARRAGRSVRTRRSPGPTACCAATPAASPRVVDPPDPALVYTDAYYRGDGRRPAGRLRLRGGQPGAHRARATSGGASPRASRRSRPSTASTRWLDAGCGTGGLVRVRCATRVGCDAVGHEEGWALARLREARRAGRGRGGPDAAAGALRRRHRHRGDRARARPDAASCAPCASLLRPGGLLFLTTGNAAAHRGDARRLELRDPRDPRQLLRAAHAGARHDGARASAAHDHRLRRRATPTSSASRS